MSQLNILSYYICYCSQPAILYTILNKLLSFYRSYKIITLYYYNFKVITDSENELKEVITCFYYG